MRIAVDGQTQLSGHGWPSGFLPRVIAVLLHEKLVILHCGTHKYLTCANITLACIYNPNFAMI